jgi:hypothetical protein
MPRFLRTIADVIERKDTVPVNSYEGFQGNGAVVLRDRRGTAKAEIPDVDLKASFGGDDPLAIYKPTGAKHVDAAKAMGSFTGWTYAAVNAIAREVSNIQWRLYQVNGEDHEEVTTTILTFRLPASLRSRSQSSMMRPIRRNRSLRPSSATM